MSARVGKSRVFVNKYSIISRNKRDQDQVYTLIVGDVLLGIGILQIGADGLVDWLIGRLTD